MNVYEAAREDFVRLHSVFGLFQHYARIRLKTFFKRQGVIVFVGALFVVFGYYWIGIFNIIVPLLGDVIDCIVIHYILKNCSESSFLKTCWLAQISAGFQAFTISCNILFLWHTDFTVETHFLAAAILMWSFISAGLMRRFFKIGCDIKIFIYVATSCIMFVDLLYHQHDVGREHVFTVVAILILFYTAYSFIRSVDNEYERCKKIENKLLDERVVLNQSQEQLRTAMKLSERLSLVARYSGDSIIFIAPDHRIEWVNETFTKVTGYSFEESIGCIPSKLFLAKDLDPKSLAKLNDSMNNKTSCRVEIKQITKDGRYLWMDTLLTPVFDKYGNIDLFIAVKRDITQIKEQHDELIYARQSAEVASQAKTQFLATMSHEIRTPLNGILGMAELLRDTKLTKTQQQYTSIMIESGRALLCIINDVLDLSKLQSGKMELQNDVFYLPDIVDDIANLLRPTAQKKNVFLYQHVKNNFQYHLGDQGKLRQVLLNIVGNALKFTEVGSVEISLQYETIEKNDQIRVIISDTGIGIANDRLEHIFESFSQADNTISRRFGGTGLGLTISRHLMQQMGGDIQVESVLGQGTKFILSLNLPIAEKKISQIAHVDIPITDLRVLVAEDNKTNFFILKKILERAVCEIELAQNGALAVASYKKFQPDLILMDISMPEMDGLEASRQIREYEKEKNLPRCPMYAISAFSAEDNLAMIQNAGMDGALIKPFLRSELYALIAKIAQQRPISTVPFDLSLANNVEQGKQEQTYGRYCGEGA